MTTHMRGMRKAIIAMILGLAPLCVSAQTESSHEVGLGDRVGIGLSAGTMTGLAADLQIPIAPLTAIQIEADYGAGIATWGISETWQALLAIAFSVTNDHVNNALVLSPGLTLGAMIGHPADQRGWFDLSPFETVHSLAVVCEVAWVHEFASWSMELGLRPGEAYAFDGRDHTGNAFFWGSDERTGYVAKGEYSVVFSALFIARF